MMDYFRRAAVVYLKQKGYTDENINMMNISVISNLMDRLKEYDDMRYALRIAEKTK